MADEGEEMNRYLLRRILALLAIVLSVAGVVTFVLAKVLGWSSIGTTIGILISWLPAAVIALAFLVRAILPSPYPVPDTDGLGGAGETINDLYLGRVETAPIVRSAGEYSAYPPPGDTGR
jgi:hypothetical protein